MSGLNVSTALRALGGVKSGKDSILCAGPGHGKRDTSLLVSFDAKRQEGFAVYSFSGDDWKECKDYVRAKLGLPEWKPTRDGEKREQPTFVVREHVYVDANGEEYHRVDVMSDGGFKHYRFDIDGFVPGEPDMVVPYALDEVLTDETIWLVYGEGHADLIRDGFGAVATTYPSGMQAEPDASFIHHFAGRDVRVLDAGGARAGEFARKFADALGVPVHRLPDGFRTLRSFAAAEGASLDQCVSSAIDPATSDVKSAISPTPFQWIDASKIKPREWLYGDHLIRKFVSLTVSPGGLGKSSLALVEAMCMASGRELLKDTVHEPEPLRVWYWNGEDPQEETQRRVIAAAKHYGLKPSDFAPRLFTDSGREQPIILGEVGREGITINEKLFLAIEQTMIDNRIDVFMADPFVSAHRMGENDNNAIDAIIKRLGTLADRTNAAVEIVHHVRKPAKADDITDVNDARGASALIGGVRSARVLNVMPVDIARSAGVPDDLRQRHFSVSNGKANMSAKASQAQWRFLESVCLGNQTETRKADNVGVVTRYELPESAQDAVDLSGAENAMRLILSMDDMVRHWHGRGPKPKNWIVHRIMEDLNIHDQNKEPVLHKLVCGWIKDGIVAKRSMLEKNNRVTVLTMETTPFEAPNDDETQGESPF